MAGQSENVAILNPLVLPLPSWHPDGPDGKIDGFVIPFLFPDIRPSGRQPNRSARIHVGPTVHGEWRASLRNCQDHAETAEQARAFAAAWIRAAEILENASKTADKQPDDDVVDCEVVDDEDQGDESFAPGRRVMINNRGDWGGRFGQIYATHLNNQPPMLDVELDPPGRPDDPNEPVMITVRTDDVVIGRLQ